MLQIMSEHTTFQLGSMLNMVKVELQFIPDPGMYLFFEKSMRGRVSYISKSYSKANNKYLKSYDQNQE